METTLILQTIEQSLVLLNKLVPDHATRISEKIKSFRERWDAEYAKGENRNDNMLDLLELELRDIRELFSDAIKAAASKNS